MTRTDGRAVTWALAPSDLGRLLVATTDRGLCRVDLGDDAGALERRLVAAFPASECTRDDAALAGLVAAVRQRIAGDPDPTPVPLDIAGTAFQCRVWDALARIPYGEVRTYGQVAEAVGTPKAVRAVGTACGANPVGLVVPCHRVVPARGGIGSYGFGVERKRALLRREGASVVGNGDEPGTRGNRD